MATRKEIATLRGHAAEVQAVAFSRDGKTLASAGFDYVIRRWDVGTWQECAVLKRHNSRGATPADAAVFKHGDAAMLGTGSKDFKGHKVTAKKAFEVTEEYTWDFKDKSRRRRWSRSCRNRRGGVTAAR